MGYKNLKNTNLLLVIFISIGFLFSCTPQTNKTTTSSTSSESVDNADDSDSSASDSSSNSTPINIEYNGQNYTSTFIAPSTFSDTINLKGSNISNYIENNSTTIYCAITYFPNINGGTNLVVAGLPRSQTNIATGITENFISLTYKANEKSLSQSFCQNPSVTTTVNALNIGNIVYSVADLCPTCSNENRRSQSLAVVTSDGATIDALDGFNLNLELVYSTQSFSASECQSNNECTTTGFDCCLNNQCVNDGELKKTYTAADPEYASFLAALIDVASNENNKTRYPQFYFICGELPPSDGSDENDDETALTPNEEARERFLELKYLYECTTPIDGEQSICTTFYDDITATDVLFRAGDDDRDFSITYTGTLPEDQAIYEVIYQNESLYIDGTYRGSASDLSFAGTNDVLTSSSLVTVNKTFNEDSKYKSARIRYRIDGSCTEINSNVASCYKTYIQGQNIGSTTDHFPASNEFLIPRYRDTSKSVIVEVDGIKMSENQDFVVINSTPSFIRFIDIETCATPSTPSLCPVATIIRVLDTQEMKITFSVDQGSDPVLSSKKVAQARIGEICTCPDNNCTLEEVKDSNDIVVNYQCVSPPADTVEPPLQQLIRLSSKRTPHLHFNSSGLYKSDLTQTEVYTNSINEQEGTAFEYTNLNPLTPNNISTYIGFNEIYGSYTYGIGSALPAKEVPVKKGTTYDITSTKGSFTNCYNCGFDYYSNLVRLFPENLTYSGGGFKPDYESSSKLNASTYRADEQAFGRSCYVPATMIPWGHKKDSNVVNQRRDRLAAQHFLHANGYQRDWYGFDYGALIGSFDGVKWFAIGTSRRIKAKSNRLFLAFNAFYGDQTLDNNTFDVIVQDSIINGTDEFPESDIATTAAECQQAYICQKDSDCAATLGWEYACEDVSGIKGNFPRFDDNGQEIPFTEESLSLMTLVSRYEGSTKRCVYRGRGALCTTGYNSAVAANTYSKTDKPRHHACSANSYCQPFTDSNGDVAKFNNRINRIPRSIFEQNSQLDATEYRSSVGIIAPIIGRPFNYVGTETIDAGVKTSLAGNDNYAICLPGKVTNNTFTAGTLASLNDAIPNSSNPTATSSRGAFNVLSDSKGDTISGIGVASSDAGDATFLSCPVFDENGEDIRFSMSTTSLVGASDIHSLAKAQNLSSKIITDNFSTLVDTSYVQNYEQSISASGNTTDDDRLANGVSFENNACLRAPGSTCFTNLDCAANGSISGTLSSITTGDLTTINDYELLFWQSEMICSQPASYGDVDYDIRKNRCCRDTDNSFRFPTALDGATKTPINEDGFTRAVDTTKTPLSETANTSEKLSSATLIHYQTNKASDPLPALQVATPDACSGTCNPTANYEGQFKTVDSMAARMCCSENWIRNFSDTQGGGHIWSPTKFQQLDTSSFTCLNYYDFNSDGTQNNSVDCQDPLDPNCEAISIPEVKANQILEWLSTMELVGIPNVIVPVIDTDATIASNLYCTNDLSGGANYLENFLNTASTQSDYDNNGAGQGNRDNFISLHSVESTTSRYSTSANIKTVFSPDSFSCCLPGGTVISNTENDSRCCTGNTTPVGASSKRCTLPDYSNVSVYLNRFVSSEANTLDEAAFDSKTGFILDTATEATIACSKGLCPGGYLVKGLVYGRYGISGLSEIADDSATVNRFAEGPTDNFIGSEETGIFNYIDAGLKFNNHLYCVSQEVGQTLHNANRYEVYPCSN